jgi:hypothetical protein
MIYTHVLNGGGNSVKSAVKSLRGKRVKVGYWMRLGSGTTVPGLGLRQNLKGEPGEGFYFRGGVGDPAVWNHFETEGRLSNDLESMDIHTWCGIPEAELAKNCFFYIDDVSLEAIGEPPLSVTTPLDEYYVGETIPWTVSAGSARGDIKIAMQIGDRLVEEQTHKTAAGSLRGTFESRGLKCGIYTLQARTGASPQVPQTAQRQIILTPNPWEK